MIDASLIAAYLHLLQAHGVSVDELVATPQYREAFLADVRQALGHVSERDALMRLFTLRKRSKLPRVRDLTESAPAA